MANAICPDDSTWYMADYYLDKPRCYGLYPVPQNLSEPIELLEVCTEKNANAKPVSIHNADEHNFIYNNTMDGGLIGLYLPSGKTYGIKNFKNMDGTTIDYAPVTETSSKDTTLNSFMSAKMTFSPTPFEKYITSVKANVICAMWAVRAP
uniref:Fimbrial protein n=1 Tax=Panagrellus redivivus TaxID=6233 RepID=A0A7E4VH06_PANRE